ncbi:MAG TPA: HD domain-containing phosphohydrolase [Dongiaceae bacterium]|nr:HD domain-containing phosphohydrolase [Dongiaceae bacterium]
MSMRQTPRADPAERPTLTGLLAALSFALDLAEGQRFGHSLRSTLIAMGLAERLDLDTGTRRDLFHAMLVKDIGGPGTSDALCRLFGGDDRRAKHDLKRLDWRRWTDVVRYCAAHDADPRWFARTARSVTRAGSTPQLAAVLLEARATHGAARVRELGLGEPVASAIEALDEHWDGGGRPRGLDGSAIPMIARIASLAQSAEVCLALGGPQGAFEMADDRRGRWFDPTLVSALGTLGRELEAWTLLGEDDLLEAVLAREPGSASVLVGDGMFTRVARTYARVTDSKSPWTDGHSERVAATAERIARELDLGDRAIVAVRGAALLHDLGKLSLPNSILDKQGPLSNEEWEAVRRQPYYTYRILSRVRGLGRFADNASSHHERIDGRGYFRGLRGDRIPLAGRILAVADSFEALITDRPFRPAFSEETALRLLARDRDIGIDAECHAALTRALDIHTIEPLRRAA